MYKIRILLALTVGLALLYFTAFLSSVFGHNIFQYYETNTLEDKLLFGTLLLVEIVVFVALLFVSVGLMKIIKSGVFNDYGAKNIKIGGVLFLLASLTDIIYVIYSTIELGNPELWIQRIFTNILLLLLGLIALIVSDVLYHGLSIKKENDLTI